MRRDQGARERCCVLIGTQSKGEPLRTYLNSWEVTSCGEGVGGKVNIVEENRRKLRTLPPRLLRTTTKSHSLLDGTDICCETSKHSSVVVLRSDKKLQKVK